jgi:hypothetical protein
MKNLEVPFVQNTFSRRDTGHSLSKTSNVSLDEMRGEDGLEDAHEQVDDYKPNVRVKKLYTTA